MGKVPGREGEHTAQVRSRVREILERDRLLVGDLVPTTQLDEACERVMAAARRSAFGPIPSKPSSPSRSQPPRAAGDAATAPHNDRTHVWAKPPRPELLAGATHVARPPQAVPASRAPAIPPANVRDASLLSPPTPLSSPPPLSPRRPSPSTGSRGPRPGPPPRDAQTQPRSASPVGLPIRTRTMARLLTSQGNLTLAHEIYAELCAAAADDAELRAEAERVAAACALQQG